MDLWLYLLVVNGSKISTKNFLSLYIGACKADKIFLKVRQPSTNFLCILQEPYIISGIVPIRKFKIPLAPAENSNIFLE